MKNKNPMIYFGIADFFKYLQTFINFHEQGRKKCQNGISNNFSALAKVHFFRKKYAILAFLTAPGTIESKNKKDKNKFHCDTRTLTYI